MVEPELLNPKDVLAHLNSLGYYDITPRQLKDFLHDLKKLIKYDQKQTSQSFMQFETSNSISCEYDCSCSHRSSSSDTASDKSYDTDSVSKSSSTCTYKGENSLKDDSLNNIRSAGSSEKVPSSFIRPWHLSARKTLSKGGKKNPDPVKLYHQYKELWNKLNIPGETKHSQLRWVIRNKMMGQKPQPRVII